MFNVESCIIIGFLIINLAIGLFSGRGVKTVKEYAIGNRNFSTSTIAATIVATWISGSALRVDMSGTYETGILYLFSVSGSALVFLLLATIFIPRMGQFLGKNSIAQAMGDIYGKEVRIVTIICGFLLCMGPVAAQFKVASELFSHFTGTSNIYASSFAGAIVILYSSYGGIRSVTFTDVIQVFTFGIFLPGLCFFIWQGLDEISSVKDVIQNNPIFNISNSFTFSNPNFIPSIALFIYFLIPDFGPAIFQRIAMSKDIDQARKSFYIGFVVCFIVTVLTCFIGILMLAKYPNTTPDELLPLLIDGFSYPGLTGLMVVGVLAMLMSTADSYINSSAVLISYDLCQELKVKFTDKTQLLVARICSFVVGIGSIGLSFTSDRLLDLFFISTSIYSIVTTTFILTVLGFRTTKKCIFIGMFLGFACLFAWLYHFEAVTEINSFVPCIFCNTLGILLSHYILRQPGGWIGTVVTGQKFISN
ncbi:MAG: sodium:solute symporter family protein [Rickettsiaceae bacterium]|nr:sodium:solute symporter family protein [Rickettsiaceae bacterium]